MDAYDSDCDDLSLAKAFLMANLSSCDPEVLSEVPYSDSYPNDMINQDVQEMQYSEQTHVDDFEDNEIHSGSNIISVLSISARVTRCGLWLLNKQNHVEECNKCLELETGLLKKKYFIEKEAYDKLVKSYSNLEKHCISLKLATQLNQEIFQRENSSENLNATTFNQLFEINELKTQSQEKDTVIRKLKERIKSLSGKDSVENVKKDIDEIETINIEPEHSVAKLLSKTKFEKRTKQKVKGKNVVNTAVSKPNATIATGMFKVDIEPISPRLKNNRDAHETCPSSPKPSGKLVAITPINKDKRVRFTEPLTSLNNIPKQTDSLKTKDSNNPLLTSTGVKPTTSASGSKPSGNTENNRITRPPQSNLQNKVEDHSRNVKSSLNKINSVSEPISNALVKHSMRNAKFESICAICNKCLFNDNHDMYLIDFVNDVNWKPTGRLFTIVGNSCPLTRITAKKIVHLKETTSKSVVTPKPEIKVYSRRPKPIQLVDVPSSSSLVNDRLRHNLFSVGQLCDADLEVSFQKNTCFIRNLEGVNLLSGSRDTNLYTISLDDMLNTSPICLLSKASKTKNWL
ncbi:hypothetical protein Tco_1105218 [Tanacetum coccineum]